MTIGSRTAIAGAMLTFGIVAGCSVAPDGVDIHDPYESTNRAIHGFNKDLDSALLRPVSTTIVQLPDELTDMLTNFAANIALPGMVLNGLLQGDLEGAAKNTVRFALNSTIGIGGLFDPAGEGGLYEETTDFGETLAVWGVPEGAYQELPILGPSTERDTVGYIVDLFIDPLGHIGPTWQSEYALAATFGSQLVDRGRFAATVDSILYESADSYAQSRLLYLQNRRFALGAGSVGAYLDPYGDDFADPYALPAADPNSGFVDPYEDF